MKSLFVPIALLALSATVFLFSCARSGRTTEERAPRIVKIGKNVRIGSDNIIGWGSIVTKSFESSNQLLVGSPAKVVKTGVRWDGRTIKEYMKGSGR